MKIQITDLNDVKVGDLICDNVTKKPMRIMATSENYLYGIQKNFGKEYYTVYAKEPEGIYHNGNGWHIPTKNNQKFFFRGPGNTWGIDEDLTPEEIIAKQKTEIELLKAKVEFLSDLKRLEREAMWAVSKSKKKKSSK